MNFDDIYYFSAGGILGNVLSNTFLPYFSFVGSTLIFLMFTCSGFVLLTGFSWLNFIDNVGRYCISFFMVLKDLPQTIKNQFGTGDLNTNDHEQIDNELEKDSIETVTHTTDSEVESPAKKKISMPFFNKQSTLEASEKAETQEPFVDIDDLMDGPFTINVQEHVDDSEITAAFSAVEKIDVADDQQPRGKLSASSDTSQVNLVPSVEEKFEGMPSIDLLDRADKAKNPINQEELEQVSRLVEAKLLDFKVVAQVVAVYPGPVITRFELDLAPGMKVSKISSLSKDLARALSAISVRVVEVIPGKSVIGLELPNKHREIVRLSEVISCKEFEEASSSLTMVLGKDIAGEPVVVDLAKMPHLLVAGTTGSGKSVGVNTMIVSLLYKSTPEDVRLIMIDPKMLELSVYEGIPHLLAEVVTDMKDAANALRWCVAEMERRYKLMSALGVRNLKGYNKKVLGAIKEGEPIIDPLWQPSDGLDQTPPQLEKLPSIVVIVDEFADMMMIVGKKVEELIARIAQKARAAGIHLILATQRPSVDVITGLIKANIPTRMAFQVSSGLNSRTILDQQGAEQLLGMGDMLYLPPGTGVPTRVHGAFIDDHEVHAVVKDWKLRGEPNYIEEILAGGSDPDMLLPGEQPEGSEDEELDTLYDEAVHFVTEKRRVSISSVQRQFRIGYNRSARIVEQMEIQGIVSTAGNNGAREVLAPPPIRD
jgi:S-DNA-T family DNA segregation ATPase FtsK/SpoIIIE